MRTGAMVRGALALAALAMLGLTACSEQRRDVDVGPSTADRLARSLSIIRTSTAAEPKVLRVLFYGQSISSPKWTDRAAAHLRATYPNTRFEVQNLAIGGFSAPLLERTAERDVTAAYPDLIVFHVYGDSRAYERIIRTMRAKTAAEIIVETDHVVEPVEPICREGIHLTLTPPPGCKGRLWYKQHLWEEHMSGVVIPQLADRYALAIEPRRRMWNAYLQRQHLKPEALIADTPHPNDRGWRVMAAIFGTWFDRQVKAWRGERSTLVSTLPLPAAGAPRRYEFDGNRIELIARAPLDGKVTATIDGKAPQDIDGCWQTSRTTMLPGVPAWPAIRQVTVAPTVHQAEHWTATVTGLNAAQDRFRFSVTSDRRGPDGEGEAGQDFTSRSGDIRIAARDWVLPEGVALKQQRVPEGFRIQWQRALVCADQPAVELRPGKREVRHVIATGLSNGRHRLMLTVAPDAIGSIREIRVYRPPLADDGTS